MDISEVKAALGKKVRFRNEKLHCNGVYVLTGCVIRRSDRSGFSYQAEIQDTQQNNSVSIVSLKDIEVINDQGLERQIERIRDEEP